ncbi:MAG: GNAT family N-acetyltransferase [bacterium]|nr:GNAT family N-acetyltransferase [bacterium]
MTHTTQSPAADATFPFIVRPFRWEDIAAIAAVHERNNHALGNPDPITEQSIRSYYEVPEFEPEQNVFVVTDTEGRVIAVTELEHGEESGRSWVDGAVDPDYWNQGIGTHLMRLSEEAALAYYTTRREPLLPPDEPISVERAAEKTFAPVKALYAANGYRYIRTFYRMRIAFVADASSAPAPLPTGLQVRPVQPEHYRAIYEAHQEAFRDHWGWEPYPYEEWHHWVIDNPNADPSLWRVIWDGDQVAALAINRFWGDDRPDFGWVGILATRRPWRKQGLAEWLLRNSFQAFQAVGLKGAGLGVDAASLTNAVALYERVGMQVERQYDEYAKMLRGEWLSIFPPGE